MSVAVGDWSLGLPSRCAYSTEPNYSERVVGIAACNVADIRQSVC